MNRSHQQGGQHDKGAQPGMTDVMVKLKEDRVPLSRAQELFKGVDQGGIVAIHIQLRQGGSPLEDPIVKLYRVPTIGAAGKAFYEALIPHEPGDAVLTAYIKDGQLTYLTGNDRLAELNTKPVQLAQLARAFAGIQNKSKGTASQRVFFVGQAASEDVTFGGDLITMVGTENGRWAQVTTSHRQGIVAAEYFRDNQGGKLLAYRTDDQGRRTELVMINASEIHRNPEILTKPQDSRWQRIAGVPEGFDGTFMWAGRFRRTEAGSPIRTAVMGLTSNQAVPVTLYVDEGRIEYGKIVDTDHIPVTSFRFGSPNDQIALQQRDAAGTRVTIGTSAGTPAYQRILDAANA